MKTWIWLGALGAGLTLAGCGEPASPQVETAPVPLEAEIAPSADDQSVPAAETGAPTDPLPADSTSLPPTQPSSEQTVTPESETLFY